MELTDISISDSEGGVPFSSIPTFVRESSPEISDVLSKSYKALTETDCIMLFNVHLDYTRQRIEGDSTGRIAALEEEHRIIDDVLSRDLSGKNYFTAKG